MDGNNPRLSLVESLSVGTEVHLQASHVKVVLFLSAGSLINRKIAIRYLATGACNHITYILGVIFETKFLF